MVAAESAGVGVVVTVFGPEARHIYVSPVAAALIGRSVAEATALGPLEWTAPEMHPDVQARVSARQRGEERESRWESRFIAADGTTVPVEIGVGRVTIDGVPASVLFVTDLSARKRSEEVLRLSEARFRALIESAPDAIVISRKQEVTYANAATAVLLGYDSPGQMRGITFADFLHPDDVRTMAERVGHLRVGGSPLGPYEYRARSRDGRAIVVEVTSMLAEDVDGPAVIGFARDVTHARRLQAQLMRADRLAALGTMAAGVAHEINNPLAFMMLGLDAIDRQLARGDACDRDVLSSTVADVRHGVERISAIVRQLRAFSRTDDGSPRALADLRAVLDAAARMAAHEIKPLGTLTVSVPDDLSAVRGEPSQLEQVFLNLLLNAAQALDQGRSDGRIEVVARAMGDAVEVLVRDHGRGMREEDAARVFDPFFTTKPVGSGTGLGLSICHSIITGAGGEIGISSELGRGTTVRVVLPMLRAAVIARSTPPQPAQRDRLRSLRILIADDEPAFLRASERLLSGEHEVLTVLDGETAWARIEERAFDVILLDVTMPELNGMELFDRIRARRPGLVDRVAFVTGGTAREHIERFIARTGRPILRKPFDTAKLHALLRRIGPR